ncbi:MAG: SDR family oxidoreductase [Anaerolineae bacterium]|nr:SDR family oxidoreductase [Anaerolineae bacterium]
MAAEILVTGVPGNVGSEVVAGLIRLGIPFRVGLFDLRAPHPEYAEQVEIIHFDFLKPETHRPAFEGIKRLFLVRPPALANVERDIAPALRTAIDCGVEHIVFLSIQGVENNRIVPHHKIEQIIEESGVKFTFLRASFFMQNLSTTQASKIRNHNEIALPVGNAKTSFIDVRDIGAVAVCALTDPQHENKKYTLTGQEALDYHQVAGKLTAILHRPIHYSDPSVFRFIYHQLRSGHQLGYALVVAGLYTITRFGNAKQVSQDVQRVLGRSPISFDQFVRDYRDCWQNG